MPRSKKQPPMAQGHSDDFQTPPYALMPLLPYLERKHTIWECAAGNGNLVAALREWGFTVTASDILTGQDYLYYSPSIWDLAITNPPFSLKNEFLERAYDLGRPFAFLLPLTTFESIPRQALFRRFGIQVIFMDHRIQCTTPSGRNTGVWFASAWFTYGMGLPAMQFYEFPQFKKKAPR